MVFLLLKIIKMTGFFKRLSYLILAFLVYERTNGVNGQCKDWNLERLNENSRVYFMNSSISDGFILSCWVWRDSRSGGIWDTRLRIALDGNGTRGGGFNFRDSSGRETLSLRWVAHPGGNVTWQAWTKSTFPVSSWNTTAVGSSWGYSTTSDGRWYFHLDNKTIEPTTMPITNVLLVVPQRWRRSIDTKLNEQEYGKMCFRGLDKYGTEPSICEFVTLMRVNQKHSSALSSNGYQGAGSQEFFETVSAILSTVLSTVTSTIGNIFNLDFLGGGSDSDGGDMTPDPDSEPITTPTSTTSTAKNNVKDNDVRKFTA